MLTGKASSFFYSWLHQRFDYEPAYNAISSSEWFESLHPSMQWGIYQDWADSMGYELGVLWISEDCYSADISELNRNCLMLWEYEFKTRQEARKAALNTLNEIINKG